MKFYSTVCFLSFIYFLEYGALMEIPIPQDNYTALMARYVMHKIAWVSIATISTSKPILGYPFANLVSISDGPVANSTGVPYVFLTDLDFTGQDLEKDNRCSIMASLAESDYCQSKDYDPQDPRCVRILISGKLFKVTDKSSFEYKFAKNALYSRHPSMKWWAEVHTFYIAKIQIEQIGVLDHFGGIQYVTVKDYFDAGINSTSESNFRIENVAVVKVDGSTFGS